MRLPINTDGLTFIAAGCEPVMKDRMTGELAIDRTTGKAMFTAHLTVFISGEVRPQVWAVKVAGEPVGVTQGKQVTVSNLVAADWENSGRHGISFRADAVVPVGAPSKQAAA